MEDKTPWINIDEIKIHPKNPKIHTDEQIQEIATSIKKLDWGRPIILSSDNYILAGEGTYLAAKDKLQLKKVPYRRMKHQHDSPEAIAYMLADNKLAEKSGWNYPELSELSIDLELQGFDVTLTGFDEIELKALKQNNVIPGEEPEYDESIADEVEMIKCPECGHEFPK